MTTGLLLLHAWPMDARMWTPQIESIGDRLPVVAPDMPGFGGAPSSGDVTTMASCARRALDALDAAGVDRAVVCGLSMGGYVAFELWRRAPELVAGMVLANTRAVADAPAALEVRAEVAARLRAEGSAHFLEELPPLLSERAPGPVRDFVLSVIADQSAEAIAAATLGLGARIDSTPDLPTINVPVVVVASTGDRMIPAAVTLEMVDQIPGAERKVLERAGHLSNLEAPEEFSGILSEHLARCEVA